MMNFLEEVKKKIKDTINPEEISLIDNSNLHAKHKSFEQGKYHIKLIIKSKKLKELKKIEAHKIIFSLLKDEIANKIHALEIEIK